MIIFLTACMNLQWKSPQLLYFSIVSRGLSILLFFFSPSLWQWVPSIMPVKFLQALAPGPPLQGLPRVPLPSFSMRARVLLKVPQESGQKLWSALLLLKRGMRRASAWTGSRINRSRVMREWAGRCLLEHSLRTLWKCYIKGSIWFFMTSL